ncbi:ROK family protein [Kribbella sp. NPDC051587]|uniref:ROK family transcriptional regulator n=1 Tax=Kribbella sp. NPDC051587 TaxID=3364119 RepID=UPI0037AB643A
MTSNLSGTQPRQARRSNTSAVLQLLAQRGPLARADIAKELSLNHASVGRILDPLLADGIVRECARESSGIGRPRTPVELDPDGRFAIGIHLGVERTTIGLTDLTGRCVETYAEDRDPADHATTVRRAGELAAGLAARARGRVLGIGVVVGGDVDRTTGTVVRNEALGWYDVGVAEPLRRRTGLDVLVDSNARAHLNAELTFGAGQGLRSVLYLFVGNVAEIGFVNHPAPLNADNIVHGSLRRIAVPKLTRDGDARFDECGTDLILLAAARSAGLATPTLADLVRLADEHDPTAVDLLTAHSAQVAVLADTVYDLMRPNLVILGGSGAPTDRWLEVVRGQVETVPPQSLTRPRATTNPLVTASGSLVVRQFFAGQLRTW